MKHSTVLDAKGGTKEIYKLARSGVKRTRDLGTLIAKIIRY